MVIEFGFCGSIGLSGWVVLLDPVWYHWFHWTQWFHRTQRFNRPRHWFHWAKEYLWPQYQFADSPMIPRRGPIWSSSVDQRLDPLVSWNLIVRLPDIRICCWAVGLTAEICTATIYYSIRMRVAASSDKLKRTVKLEFEIIDGVSVLRIH